MYFELSIVLGFLLFALIGYVVLLHKDKGKLSKEMEELLNLNTTATYRIRKYETAINRLKIINTNILSEAYDYMREVKAILKDF